MLCDKVVDRHSSNLKAERFLEHRKLEAGQQTWSKHVQKCEVHIVSQSNTSATNLLTDDISGMLSLAMAQQSSGALKMLRGIVAEVLQENLEIVYQTPPQGRLRTRREEIYNLFLPVQEDRRGFQQNVMRRYVLSNTLNGDLAEARVQHYCPFGCCLNEAETVQKLSTFTAWALAPCTSASRLDLQLCMPWDFSFIVGFLLLSRKCREPMQ